MRNCRPYALPQAIGFKRGSRLSALNLPACGVLQHSFERSGPVTVRKCGVLQASERSARYTLALREQRRLAFIHGDVAPYSAETVSEHVIQGDPRAQ